MLTAAIKTEFLLSHLTANTNISSLANETYNI